MVRTRPSIAARLLLLVLLSESNQNTGTSTCLQDGIAPGARKNIMVNGEEMPLGIFFLDWYSAQTVAQIYKTIAEEVLGYNVVRLGDIDVSAAAVYALAGCLKPENYKTDAQCSDTSKDLRHHIALEVWTSSYQVEIDSLRENSDTFPVNLGSVGYEGTEGMYLTESIYNTAFTSERVYLDYYKTYDADWHTSWTVFDRVWDIDTADLKPCSNTKLYAENGMRQYLTATQDTDGVEVLGNTVRARCWNGTWWLSSACRTQQEHCIPLITGGQDGWSLYQIMQWATWHNMPLAIAVSPQWNQIPRRNKVLFYWYPTDVTFVDLSPASVMLPPHREIEWLQHVYKTGAVGIELGKYVSSLLGKAAPEAFQLASKMLLSQEHILALMTEASLTGATIQNVTCKWLRNNQSTWKLWMPNSLECVAGQGLIDGAIPPDPDDLGAQFVETLQSATGCNSCTPGRFSRNVQLGTTSSRTHICKACPVGTSTENLYGVLRCEECDAGYFTDEEATHQCKRCGKGDYTEERGSSRCSHCSALAKGATTEFMGAFDRSKACECPSGSYFGHGECKPCPLLGIRCPGGHLVTNNNTVDFTVLLTDGFMSTSDDPLAPYRCAGQERCVGERSPYDKSLICKNGFTADIAQCALCERGSFIQRASDTCTKCDGGLGLYIFLMSLNFLRDIGFHVWIYKRYNRPNPSGLVTVGLTLTFLQALLAVQLLPLNWPPSMRFCFDCLEWLVQVFLIGGFFSLSSMGQSCHLPFSIALETIIELVKPIQPFVFYGVFSFVGYVLNRPLRFDFVINSIGIIFKSLFITISRVGLKLFIYDRMPNGKNMVKDIPGLEEFSPEWWALCPFAVLAVLLYCIGFLTLVGWATWQAPARAARSARFMLRFRFAFGIYRPDRWWWIMAVLFYGFLLSFVQAATENLHLRIYSITTVTLVILFVEFQAQPYKFIANNHVDLTYKCTLLWFTVVMTSFFTEPVVAQLRDEWANADFFAAFSIFSFATAMTYAFFAFGNWAHEITLPHSVSLGRRFYTALQFRDIVATIVGFPYDRFMRATCKMGEEDFLYLERVMQTIIAVFMDQQPTSFRFGQRVLPGVAHSLWTPQQTMVQSLESTLDGKMRDVALNNAKCRLALITVYSGIKNEMEQGRKLSYRTVTTNIQKKVSVPALKRSKSIMQTGIDSLRKRFNLRHIANSGTFGKIAAVLGMEIDSKLTCQQFCDMIEPFTEECSREDLKTTFEMMDFKGNGSIGAHEFIQIMSAIDSELGEDVIERCKGLRETMEHIGLNTNLDEKHSTVQFRKPSNTSEEWVAVDAITAKDRVPPSVSFDIKEDTTPKSDAPLSAVVCINEDTTPKSDAPLSTVVYINEENSDAMPNCNGHSPRHSSRSELFEDFEVGSDGDEKSSKPAPRCGCNEAPVPPFCTWI